MTKEAVKERFYWDQAAHDPNVSDKYINNMDVDLCLTAITPYLNPGRTLDIGCGIGRTMNALVEAGAVSPQLIYGVDISQAMVNIAKDKSPWAGPYTYRQGDGRTLPFDREQFESVYSMLVFQHIPDDAKRKYIEEAWRVLKTGGIFRVQYVRGNHHADTDHNATLEDMGSWMLDAGFEIDDVNPHLIHKDWDWITGRKA